MKKQLLIEKTLHTSVRNNLYGSAVNAADDIASILKSRYGDSCPYTAEAIAQMTLGELAVIIEEYLFAKADDNVILSEYRDGVVLMRKFLELILQLEDYEDDEDYENSIMRISLNMYFYLLSLCASGYSVNTLMRLEEQFRNNLLMNVNNNTSFCEMIYQMDDGLRADPAHYREAYTAVADAIVVPWAQYMHRVEGTTLQNIRKKAQDVNVLTG